MIALFLILGFYVESGRLYIINNNDNIIVVANHRVIHERIKFDVELIKIVQIIRRGKDAHDNQLVDYPYNPRTFGHSNFDYLKMLSQCDDYGQAIMTARLYYLGGKLVMVEIREQDR